MSPENGLPGPLRHLIEELSKLPGVGTRTAERLAYYLLKADQDEAMALARAIQEVKSQLRPCRECFNFSESELCPICRATDRDRRVLMVVEHPKDLMAFERTGRFRGIYHVLLGHVSPHDGVGLQHLAATRLAERIAKGGIEEVILATNPDAEGDATALALTGLLEGSRVKLSRLARGLPAGYSIEYAGTEMLADALEGRRAPFGSGRKE